MIMEYIVELAIYILEVQTGIWASGDVRPQKWNCPEVRSK